jgi:hypothetical protein
MPLYIGESGNPIRVSILGAYIEERRAAVKKVQLRVNLLEQVSVLVSSFLRGKPPIPVFIREYGALWQIPRPPL